MRFNLHDNARMYCPHVDCIVLFELIFEAIRTGASLVRKYEIYITHTQCSIKPVN